LRFLLVRGRLFLLVMVMALAMAAFGQTSPQQTLPQQTSVQQSEASERIYAESKAEVEAALRSLQVSSGGRLPTLDGFIGEQSLPVDRLQRPHYIYAIAVVPAAGSKSSGCVVRIRARITAWYAGASPAQSGYRELPSNGRLESDLFERLEDLLAQKSGQESGTKTAMPPAPKASAAAKAGTSPNPLFAVPRSGLVSLPPRSAADSTASAMAPGSRDSASYAQGLRDQAKNLEEILRNQTHPTDLAAVKKAKTPVYSRPSEQGDVLFLADAQDEFQVLNTSTEWVHVQISGLSRGWIRGPDLELPRRPSAASSPPDAPQPTTIEAPAAARSKAASTAGPAFRLARQEVNTYPGDWAPLQGKSVRIYSLAPTGTGPTSGSQKWEAARAMFQRAAARLAGQDGAAAPVEGVVLIFDSADGGMASATVTSLREWDSGRISDDAFREQCSFDPREAFRNSAP
jgi:hypothetical protein